MDARSDVFAAGIVLWELLAGQRLYRSGAGRPTPLEQARQAVIPPLPTRGYPDEERLHAIVRGALVRDPQARCASAQAMLRRTRDVHRRQQDSSPVRSGSAIGSWSILGGEIVEQRRERERAAKQLDENSGTRETFAAASGAPARLARFADRPTERNADGPRTRTRDALLKPQKPSPRRVARGIDLREASAARAWSC